MDSENQNFEETGADSAGSGVEKTSPFKSSTAALFGGLALVFLGLFFAYFLMTHSQQDPNISVAEVEVADLNEELYLNDDLQDSAEGEEDPVMQEDLSDEVGMEASEGEQSSAESEEQVTVSDEETEVTAAPAEPEGINEVSLAEESGASEVAAADEVESSVVEGVDPEVLEQNQGLVQGADVSEAVRTEKIAVENEASTETGSNVEIESKTTSEIGSALASLKKTFEGNESVEFDPDAMELRLKLQDSYFDRGQTWVKPTMMKEVKRVFALFGEALVENLDVNKIESIKVFGFADFRSGKINKKLASERSKKLSKFLTDKRRLSFKGQASLKGVVSPAVDSDFDALSSYCAQRSCDKERIVSVVTKLK